MLAGCKRSPEAEYEALVPNVRGMERALECELDGVMLFVAASETFNQKNIRASRETMLGVATRSRRDGTGCRPQAQGAAWSPPSAARMKGASPMRTWSGWSANTWDMGCGEIGLADTVGMRRTRPK